MGTLRRLVVTALLAVWSFPAVGLAKPLIGPEAPVASAPAPRAAQANPQGSGSSRSEAEGFAAREKQAADLQDFRGGGVSIYIGSGAALVLLIILLVILL